MRPDDPAPLEPAPPAPRATDLRVLVVEDDLPLLEVAQVILTQAGWRPIPARSAEEALELDPSAFDAAVCDVMLPGATGIELAETLRRRRPGLPVVLMSGQRAPSVRAEIDATGLPFLPKPYVAADLRAALALALEGGAR